MFAPPSAIYTHGPGLSHIFLVYKCNYQRVRHDTSFKNTGHQHKHRRCGPSAVPQALVARTTPLFLTFCLQVYFQKNFFISLLFHLFFLILTCSCQYSYNLMLTSNCMCRHYQILIKLQVSTLLDTYQIACVDTIRYLSNCMCRPYQILIISI